MDAAGKAVAHLPGQHTPLPVAAAGTGDVHAVARPEVQPTLHLRNKQLRNRAHAATDDAAVKALSLIQAQILCGKGDILPIRLRAPKGQGSVIMSAGISDAVFAVAMGQIAAGVPGVKGKFQHLHARQPGIGQQLRNLRRGKAQALGNELNIVEPTGQHPHRGYAGAFDPVAVLRSGLATGHRPIALKATKMVDTNAPSGATITNSI